MMNKTRGFSLIELLAVVLVIGLAASLVSFNVGGNNSHRLRGEAKQFANNTSLIAEEAVLSNRQWGVDFFRQDLQGQEQFGYRWLLRNDDKLWQLANRETMEVEYLFSPGVELSLELEGSGEEQEIEFKRDISIAESPEESAVGGRKPEVTDGQLIEPGIWLLSSGEMNVFKLTLRLSQSPETTIDVEGDELGRIRLSSDADNDENNK
jgi:general secretion pathway protein H